MNLEYKSGLTTPLAHLQVAMSNKVFGFTNLQNKMTTFENITEDVISAINEMSSNAATGSDRSPSTPLKKYN